MFNEVLAILAEYWYLVLISLAVIVAFVVLIVKKGKKSAREKQTEVKENKEVRYSSDHTPFDAEGEEKATFTKGDIVLKRGVTLIAGSNGDIKAGKYTVLTSIDGVEAFNVRINGFVREVEHNATVILADGDTICPVSHTIVLR